MAEKNEWIRKLITKYVVSQQIEKERRLALSNNCNPYYLYIIVNLFRVHKRWQQK